MGLLVFLSEAKKLNLLNRLAAGWLVNETELKELMHRCQIMVRWFSKDRDKLNLWSNTSQIDYLCRETHSERWSDNDQMVFPCEQHVTKVVR